MKQSIKLDRINGNILRELKRNARISNADLADIVGLSPSACLRRVKELESSGVVEGYTARINSTKLGKSFSAYVTVGLSDHSKKSLEGFEECISIADEVTECHTIMGNFEYLLRVETIDLAHYKSFHTDVLGTLPQVSSITTLVVMDTPKMA